MAVWGMQSKTISVRKSGPTTACSRLATSRFFNYTLPTKLVLSGVCRADSQAADAEALGGEGFTIWLHLEYFGVA